MGYWVYINEENIDLNDWSIRLQHNKIKKSEGGLYALYIETSYL